MENSSNKVVELFAGVGGFRLGLDKSGWDTIFANQWEPGKKVQWAFDCYNKHFPNSTNSNVDIASVDEKTIPEHELLVGGFPCQDYSVASTLANSKGIQGKKGVLWWEIFRIATEKKSRFILLENVDRLLKSPAKQRGRDFGMIISCLVSLGYSVEWRVINAADYGFPQRRRRTFIFATTDKNIQKDLYGIKEAKEILLNSGFFAPAFKCKSYNEKLNPALINIPSDLKELSDSFAASFENSGYCLNYKCYTYRVDAVYSGKQITLGDVLESNASESLYINSKDEPQWAYMKGAKKEKRVTSTGHEYNYSEGPIAYPDFLDKPSRTMLTGESTKNRSTHVIRDPETNKLRLLSPVECERLDGFPDNWTNTGMPQKFRYFCMGNALVVGLIEIMGKRIQEIKG
ncbi:MAG: DNA (cytosine-5-)-methyltransferase [Sphaerochaetaceae bacterium]|nr:DNA (cytosine-5-)-methyltransferase [Sphaerochaetaceae bacterium]